MFENKNLYCYHCFAKVDSNVGDFCAECGKRHSVHYSQSYELPAGTYLSNGRYFVGESIGSGGFGITYVGFDLKLEKKILIKETFYHGLFKRNVNNKDNPEPLKVTYGKDFSLERIMQKTKKECVSLSEAEGFNNIVKVYDWFSENNTAYIITEFINGVTLDERILEKGCYSWGELYKQLKPLMKSLEKLHKKGIIHRDIKPQNIMIKNISDDEEEFILIDFGLARSVEAGTLSTMGISFSPGYSPFEQRSFNVRDGSYTDVYALAATIYFAVTGETPNIDIADTIEENFPLINKLNSEYNVPNNIVKALKFALALDYRERCNSIAELMQLFDKNEQKSSVSVQSGNVEKDIDKPKVSNSTNRTIKVSKSDYTEPENDVKKNSSKNTTENDVKKNLSKNITGNLSKKRSFFATAAGKIITAILSFANKEPNLVTSGSCGDNGNNVQWELDDSSNLYIFGSGNMANWSDDEGSPWYKNTNIKTVKIEYGVTSIGDDAFYDCESLTTVTIPDSVTSIGYYAFYGCISLTTVTIPDSVISIGYYAFGFCRSLTTVIIPDSVISIGDSAFAECRSLTTVTIPDSVTSIGDSAFWDCTSLTTVTISDSVTSIGDDAFADCTNLNKIYFKGDKPNFGNEYGYPFENVTADVYYPANNSTWNNIESKWDGGGEMTFVPYDP